MQRSSSAMYEQSSPTLPAKQVCKRYSENSIGSTTFLRAGFAEHDVRDVLPGISVPTLLLYGDEDVRSPMTVADKIRASIPGSRLVVIPGVGDLPDMEAPERFNAEVRSFLNTVQN